MANRTLISSTKLALLTTHAAVSSDTNGTGIDMTGARQALFMLKLGTTTGTSATARVLVQESSDDSSYTTIETSATVALDAGAGTGTTFAIQASTFTKQYLRYSIDVSASGSPVCGDVLACVMLGGYTYSRVAATDYTISVLDSV